MPKKNIESEGPYLFEGVVSRVTEIDLTGNDHGVILPYGASYEIKDQDGSKILLHNGWWGSDFPTRELTVKLYKEEEYQKGMPVWGLYREVKNGKAAGRRFVTQIKWGHLNDEQRKEYAKYDRNRKYGNFEGPYYYEGEVTKVLKTPMTVGTLNVTHTIKFSSGQLGYVATAKTYEQIAENGEPPITSRYDELRNEAGTKVFGSYVVFDNANIVTLICHGRPQPGTTEWEWKKNLP